MGSIITLHSFRGGTGKSNIAANLAYCCANMGVRVGILDTDMQSPGIHIIFGIEESTIKYCLNDYLKGECSIHEAVYDVSEKLQLAPESINLIPSRLKAEEIIKMLKEGFDVPKLSRGISELVEKLQLRLLFIDTHPGIEEENLLAIALSDILITILRPDEQDYLGTAITLEIAKRMEIPKTYLIANRIPKEFDLESFKKNLEATYGIPVIGMLPFSYDFMLSQSKSVYCYNSPNDSFSEKMKNVAEKIIKTSGGT